MGRPTKFTPEVQARIVEAIEAGNTYARAAAYGGIEYKTFRNWMAAGEKSTRSPYVPFFQAVKEAETKAEMAHVATIENASKRSWMAAAWWLERRYPQEWGRRDSVDLRVVLEAEAERLAKEKGLDRGKLLSLADAIARRRGAA